MHSPERASAPARPLCGWCGMRVGVYERAVWVLGTVAVASSLAATPELAGLDSVPVFHAGCYDAGRAPAPGRPAD